MSYILGVDGGGTKTLAAVADLDGNVLGLFRSGASNFQGIGSVRAGINLSEAIDGSLGAAGAKPNQILFATYGIAGADRGDDFDTVLGYVEPVNSAPRYMITNDTTIALRAGTKDGVGVALIAGTGSNTIGFSKDYRQKKVGGLGKFTGDYGSANDLAEKGVLAAMKAFDGRGRKTLMYDLFCKELNIAKLEDIIEYYYVDKFIPMRIGDYAKIVFQAANQGDRVALQILKQTGRQVGHEAVTCMRALFKPSEEIPVVLGGSVFQRGENPTMIQMLTEYIRKRFPNAFVVTLKNEPCLGALQWSLDRVGEKKASIKRSRRLASSFSRVFKEFHKRETP